MTTARPLEHLLSRLDAPLVLVDVGARWGLPKQWEALVGHAEMICFEPDVEEADRLNAEARPGLTYLPVALGRTGETSAKLYVTQQPACSSVYPPRQSLYEQYPALAEIRPVRTVEVPVRSLDSVLADRGVKIVDAMKIDTQGSEHDILQGASDALKTCAFIDVEVEFNPLYEGQPLFGDVDKFLRDHGFVLWRLSEICHYAPEEHKGARLNLMVAFSPPQEINNHVVRGGQIFWGQAQYVRATFPRTSSSRIPEDIALRAAAVVGCAGLWDLALEILSKSNAMLAGEISSFLG